MKMTPTSTLAGVFLFLRARFWGRMSCADRYWFSPVHVKFGLDSPKISAYATPSEFRGYSSVGRALEWHSRGQRFDSA